MHLEPRLPPHAQGRATCENSQIRHQRENSHERIIRAPGYLRDELREVVEAAGFEIAEESSYTYAPASVDVPPEVQILLRCRQPA